MRTRPDFATADGHGMCPPIVCCLGETLTLAPLSVPGIAT